MNIERGVPLSKLTTIGTGGPASALARPRSLDELDEALRHASAEGLEIVVVGLGSNLLVADEGVDALVIHLEGELAAVEVGSTGLVAGGGATNAVCLHRARDAGLGGFEFACAIPGTVGGGVKMNAGAYGRDWSDIVARALVATADGADWLTLDQLALSYRRSAIGPGEVVARVELRLDPRPRDDDQGHGVRVGRAEKGDPADQQAHLRKRLQESACRVPVQEACWSVCGLKGHRIGGAVISPKHANFIENADGATSSRLRRTDGRGAATSARAVRCGAGA